MRERALRFLIYGLIGVAIGLVAAGLDRLTLETILEEVAERPLWQQAIAPTLGLLIAAAILRYPGRGLSPATSEEFIRAYHDRQPRLRIRDLPARLFAGASTVGMGGALGLEGPSIYMGSTIGASVQHRMSWLFLDKDRKMLMVAGAAAGVAAIFKTPATGVLFALEVPYHGDVARRALLPALIASATSYLTFVSVLDNTDPIFEVADRGPEAVATGFDLAELAAAGIIGVLAGLGAIAFARCVKYSKSIEARQPLWGRLVGVGVILASLVVLADELFEGEPLTLGPTGAEHLFDWVTSSEVALWSLGALFVMRMLATGATLAAGGVGGVFIPLAVQGLILGRLVAEVLQEIDYISPESGAELLPAIGIAAFLGAGYRTPLASVMFVAESTGQSGFVVPGLIAAAVAQVLVGRHSVSDYQRDTRTGHLERRFRLGITSALVTDVKTVEPDASLTDFVWGHALRYRELEVPVVHDGEFLGMCRLHDATAIDRTEWSERQVEDIMLTDTPAARMDWTMREATLVMEEHDLEVLPVVDSTGRFLGVVSADTILKLDEILDETRTD